MQIGCCPISRSPIRRHRERRVPKHAALEIAQPNPAPPARARPAPQAHPARPQLPPKSNYKKMRLLISYHSLPVKNWPSDTRASRMGETTCGRPAGQAEIAAAQFTKCRGHKPHGIATPMRLECRAMAKITFLGAAGTVTGSKYLIETGNKRLLVDCGLFQGSKELQQRNWNDLTVDPASIDWVLLTHAHIDHTGYIPRLVRSGFRGPIYSNAATHELCELLLMDSAHLQEEDAKSAPRKTYSSHKPPLPLYTVPEAQSSFAQFQEIPRADAFTISPQFFVRPPDAGHILG